MNVQIKDEKILNGFRSAYASQKTNELYEKAFDKIESLAKVLSALPSYVAEIRRRDVSNEEKEYLLRNVFLEIPNVRSMVLRQFNDAVYEARCFELAFYEDLKKKNAEIEGVIGRSA